MPHLLRRPLLPLVALALVLAACSGSDSGGASSSDGSSGTSTTTAPASTTAAPAATTTTVPTGVAAGAVAPGKAVRSSGCDTADGAKLSLAKQPIGDGRFYLISTPGGDGDTPRPLVLDLHGLLEGAQIHSQMSGFGPYSQEHGFVAVFPHGSGKPVKWDVGLDRKANPDLVYLDAVLDEVEARHCIDTSRVYATGLSYGAIMSSTLACVMGDRIAAIAPVAGLTVPEGCKPSRPIPVLTFHGTADPILLFNGGVANLSGLLGGSDEKTEPPKADLNGKGYPAAAAAWAKLDGCTGEPTDQDLTASVIQRTWECPADSPVEFDIEVGAGHSWPGSEFSKGIANIVGPTDDTIDGTDFIWKFFQRFQLPAT
ncbi:hypothetical protein KSP35_11505 [Aquihabitans sp. G128]|uniref:alpha/beta hydrolase family esterase n=1 Tax=Aquihabitans sp. G128 TaxID=2849779 RepID=UPI001C24F6A4|nr:PHB depolymerase family esterase [Aquihabitans sp. G128]QXC63353.1 hypothetical protein KSP35_11505 [Aquihabitans sp. G128]